MLIRFHTEIIAFQTRVGRLYRIFPYEKSWPIFVVCIMTSWYFRTVVLEKTLESSLDSKKIKPVNPKRNPPWIFIGKTAVEAEAPILGPPDARTDALGKIEGGKRRGRQRMRWLWHHQLNGHEFEQTLGDSEGQGGLVCSSPWGHKELDDDWATNTF